MASETKIRRIINSAKNYYPWDYMLLILLANFIPAGYALFNRYFIGYMDYESIVVDQSYEALEVSFEILLEMFPFAVLALVAHHYLDKGKVKSIVKGSIILQAFITVSFVAVTFIFAENFIDWIRTPEGAQDLALKYFLIRTAGLPFFGMNVIFLIAIKAMKRGKLAVLLAFVGVVFNYILDAIFISNYSFSLRLGLIGSAWNNFASNLFLMLVSGAVLWYLLRDTEPSKINIKQTAKSVINIGKWTGGESAVRNIGYIIGVVTVVNIIGSTDESAIGGYNTMIWVMWAITLIPIIAWTEATNMAVGHAYGKKDERGMKDVQIISTTLMGSYMILWLALGNFLWDDMSAWLNRGIGGDIVDYSVTTFKYLIGTYILFAIGSGLKSFFIGTGRPASVLFSSAVVNIGIFLPVGILAKQDGFEITYIDFLWINILVFSIDLILTVLLLKYNGYRKLKFIDRLDN